MREKQIETCVIGIQLQLKHMDKSKRAYKRHRRDQSRGGRYWKRHVCSYISSHIKLKPCKLERDFKDKMQTIITVNINICKVQKGLIL